MSKPIEAGIINTTNGEILDTVTESKYIQSLYSKVSNELDPVHGKGVFLVFFFSGLDNVSFVKKNFSQHKLSDDKKIEFFMLQKKYKLIEAEKTLKNLEKEYSITKEAFNDFDYETPKGRYIKVLIEKDMKEIYSRVENAKHSVNRIQAMIQKQIKRKEEYEKKA